ncbi:hypothetical protein NE237_013989 [Protea cynaroides]|uniref:Citrate transporter-like domain-containing protein n=1 Tax=Protea cynaroides TaxID=273540 RepID=A0A9Q0H210_9MAGN|nr:hypothetical protein NE237_013989 [Protea cynaroides]
MVLSIYLERANMFEYLRKLLPWKPRGSKDLLCRICLVSAISSALFNIDTSCIVLTEFVLNIARQHNLPAHPFLLALVSSANIRTSATPIGNPQNLVIAVQSEISFGQFLLGILPTMLVGVVVNAVILLCMYWKLLSIENDEQDVPVGVIVEDVMFSPATISHLTTSNSQESNSTLEYLNIRSSPHLNVDSGHVESVGVEPTRNYNSSKSCSQFRWELGKKWKRSLWKTCVYLVTIGILISLLMDINMSWTAITALAIVVLDFKDAMP